MHRLEFCAQRMVHLNSPEIVKMLRMILFYNSDYFQSLLKHLFRPPQTKQTSSAIFLLLHFFDVQKKENHFFAPNMETSKCLLSIINDFGLVG